MNRFFSTILLLLLGSSLMAQPSKVTSGVLAQQGGNNEEAIEKLEMAISDESLFQKGKAKHLPKAHYHLFKAYLAVARDTSTKVPDALDKAVKYYQMAVDNPTYGEKWKKQGLIDNAENSLWGAFYNQGLAGFDARDDQAANKSFVNALAMSPDHILTNRMVGTTSLAVNDTVAGVKALENAISLYKQKYVDGPEAEVTLNKSLPDFANDSSQVSYMYQQLAVLYNSGYGEVKGSGQKALDLLEEGMEIDPNDEDMKRQELNIYQQNPDLFEGARKKFEQAINENPSDYQIKLAFANLLERNKKTDEAFKYYEQVNEADPTNIGGIYGVGAYYINKAASISEVKSKLTNEDEIDAKDKEILSLVEKAYPYMVKLHELQPNEREWLMQLVNITPMIGKDEEMEMYYQKMKDLEAN